MKLNQLPRVLTCLIVVTGFFARTASADAPGSMNSNVGTPTAQGALAAEQELARAIRENDADGIARLLSDDWAVVPTTGSVNEGKSIFPDGIRSGFLTRRTFELSEPRVRVYGNVAVVTSRVATSGTFNGKPFDVVERQTEVLRWQHGRWKVVLTHETLIERK